MYRCIRKCYHGNKLYLPGMSYTPPADELKEKKVPRHFVLNEQYSAETVFQAEKEENMKRVKIRAEKANKE